MVNGKEKFNKFLASIGINDFDDFDMSFLSITKSTLSQNTYLYTIEKNSPWEFYLLERFLNGLQNIKSYNYEITFVYNFNFLEDDIISLVKDFYYYKTHDEAFFDVSFVDNSINLLFGSEDEKNLFLENKLDLEGFLNFLTINFKVKYQVLELNNDFNNYVEENEETNVLEKQDQEFKEYQEECEKNIRQELEENYKAMLEERRHNDVFKKGNYVFMPIKEINENSGAVDFNGTIFEVGEPKETKTGKIIYRVGINDDSGAIYISIISNNTNLKPDDLKNILVYKNNVRIKGRADIDKFRRDLYVMCHSITLLPETPLREDNYPGEKRVELHLHTNMSEMDGISSIEEYCKLAKNMGHKSLAITDHGVVQAFPKAQQAAKKYGIKILYGCELYLIEDYIHACLKPTNKKLDDCSFVCFDFETTGLSIRYDRITEFGAIKIENGSVVDRIDILVNPEMEIPLKIVEKTKITNEMVENCPTIKEALPQILEFIGDSVLVSHNIEFDYGMLNEAMINNGYEELKNSAIDTLALSRYFFPENQRHSLGALCKRLFIDYNDDSAHRADYDAYVLSDAFLSLKTKLLERFNNCSLTDLENLEIPAELLKRRTFRSTHCTVYCKNREGLKDLYKLVSESHINFMGNVPFTPKHILQKYRKNLIVGSACFNGEVFYSSTNRGLKSLQNAIKFYDFIEIQPLENYSYLINIGDISDEKSLKRYIFDIIREAQNQNKIICATGDCHYANPEEKIFRDVYIASDGVGGVNHPLNPYFRSKHAPFENPDQHYRSTEEMLDCFSFLDDDEAYEYVVINTNKIADMCEEIFPIPDKLFPPKIDNCENLLKDLCYQNAHKLYGEKLPAVIENRLAEELNGIISNGYSVTYYIAHKLVKKANDDGYIVGSRGSVGSSFAATMAGITEVNPLNPHYRCPNCKYVEFYEGKDITSGFDLPVKYCPHCGTKMISDGQGIPFQTFLGFNAEKVPDIDLNFPPDYQAIAHDYTKVLLGENNVFRAGTISAVQLKTAYGFVKKQYFAKFKKADPETISNAYLGYLASGCVDVKRTTGQHPGGIVVIPNDLEVYDFTPVQYPAGDTDAAWKTTHFDFRSIHDTVLKLDMLGHVDPQALKMMADLTGFNYKDIPFNDEKVYSLFTTDDALNLKHKYLQKDNGASGLPEFGTNFVRQMLRETNPHNFRDLLIISGLSHGTNVWTNNAQSLIKDKIVDLRGVIGCRDDIMTYLISKGLPSSKAFKIMENVRKDKHLLDDENYMREHNIPEYYIDSCHKIKYLFPKGHACAYVMMALRVGYYKIYYPLEYYATFFTLRCDQYDIAVMTKGIDAIYEKLIEFKQRRNSRNPETALSDKEEEIEKTLNVALEMTERGFKFENIDLQKSDAFNFIIDKENKSLIPPFKVLDGLGKIACISLIEARKEKPFISKDDLLKRGKLTKTNIELLNKLGVLKDLGENEQMSIFDFV